jgi:hypothetical protein
MHHYAWLVCWDGDNINVFKVWMFQMAITNAAPYLNSNWRWYKRKCPLAVPWTSYKPMTNYLSYGSFSTFVKWNDNHASLILRLNTEHLVQCLIYN